MAAGSEYDDVCFFIAPIGQEDSETRKRSDGVLDFIVRPAVSPLGLRTVRADEVTRPGQITLNVIEHVVHAKAAVADLTGTNPNVFYELAIRHTAQLPVVLVADEREMPTLPFDIQQMRVIFFDHRDLASAARAKEAITAQLRAALDGAVDSPVSTMLNLEALSRGNSAEQALADLAAQIAGLGHMVGDLHRGMVTDESARHEDAGGLGATRASLVARTAVEADRRGYTMSFAEGPNGAPQIIVSIAVAAGQDPHVLSIPLARLTEERMRNLFRAADRAERVDGMPTDDWTHEIPVLPMDPPDGA